MVASYFICLTSDTGIPLLTRKTDHAASLPFPVIGSLNGVHMYAKNHDVQLVNTSTNNSKIYWKEFLDSLKIIIVWSDNDISDYHLDILLDNLFNSMVLLVGVSDLKNIKNVEKLKKQLKTCIPLIDKLLFRTPNFGALCQATEVLLCGNVSVLEDHLQAFMTSCDSEFGCVLIKGKVAAASERWWQLVSVETMLIVLLIRSIHEASARDIPIYLPYGSPSVPHRLITVELQEGIEICTICGPEPSLQVVIEQLTQRYWLPVLPTVAACLLCHPRNIPQSLTIDSNVLAFLFLSTDDGRVLISLYPCGVHSRTDYLQNPETLKVEKRAGILLSFYRETAGAQFPGVNIACQKGDADEELDGSELLGHFDHECTERYTISDDHRCYATQMGEYQLYTVFSSQIPSYAMSSLNEATMKSLIKIF